MTIKENFQNLCANANEAGRKQLEVSDDAPKHEHTQTYSSVEKTMIFYFEKKKRRKENKISFLENVNSNRNLVQWKWIGTIRIRWTTKEAEKIKWAERIVVRRCISVRRCIQSSKVGKYVKDLKGLHLELLVDFKFVCFKLITSWLLKHVRLLCKKKKSIHCTPIQSHRLWKD